MVCSGCVGLCVCVCCVCVWESVESVVLWVCVVVLERER